MMDNDVNQRRVAVFHLIYVYSLDVYSHWVPHLLRLTFEYFILFTALLTLCVWGYVHNTYIIHPTDCLADITQRPFPADVILQVEVYSNHSYLWEARNRALQEFIIMRQKEQDAYRHGNETEGGSDAIEVLENRAWTNYCNYSLMELLYVQPVCEAVVERIEEGWKDLKDEWLEQKVNNTHEGSSDVMEGDLDSGGDHLNSNGTDSEDSSRDPLSLNIGEDTASPSGDISSTTTTTDDDDNGKVAASTDEASDLNIADSASIGSQNDDKNDLETDTDIRQPSKSGVGMTTMPQDDLELLAALVAENKTLYELIDFYTLKLLALDYSLLEFTRETGYLSLTSATRARLNISVVKIYVDPDKTNCFGGRFGKVLTKYFLGYEVMIISSFKNLLPEKVGSGYVKDLLTGSQYYYKVQWMGKWRYLAGVLPAMFFTLVASVLLRQVHYHVFKFLTHFRNLLNQGIPMPVQTGAQIPFLIVTYAAIGLIIVMSEALSDDSMFSVLMVATVWEVDQFYSIYCRQDTSKMYFPWFFFLYHFLPYAYFVRFNGQFWFLPFLFHWLMTQHAMLFFINHFELPMNRQRRGHQINVRLPHAPVVLPHFLGLQPELIPAQQVMRFNVRFRGQQPNVEVQHIVGNAPGNPPPLPQDGANQPEPPIIAQENTNVRDDSATRLPTSQATARTEEGTLRRRNVSAVVNEATLAEEVDPRGPSEFVSGSSITVPARRHANDLINCQDPGDDLLPSQSTLRQEAFTRENVRAARLSRFERTSVEEDLNSPYIDQ